MICVWCGAPAAAFKSERTTEKKIKTHFIKKIAAATTTTFVKKQLPFKVFYLTKIKI